MRERMKLGVGPATPHNPVPTLRFEVPPVPPLLVLVPIALAGSRLAAHAAGPVPACPRRRELFDRVRRDGLALPLVRHRSAIIATSAILGDATVVFAGAIVNPVRASVKTSL